MTNEQIEKTWKDERLRIVAKKTRNLIKKGELPALMLARGEDGNLERTLKKNARYQTTNHKTGEVVKARKIANSGRQVPTIKAFVENYAFENGIELEDK